MKNRGFGIGEAQLCGFAAIPDVTPDGGRGSTGAGAAYHPTRHRLWLCRHLMEDRFGDVVVAAPVGGPLGIGELIHVVAAHGGGELGADPVDRARIIDEMAAPAIEADQRHLLRRGRTRHDRDERQAEQFCEIRLGHGSRSARCLDHRRVRPDPAVADGMKEQRARQPMLEAAGRMGGFILEIERDLGKARELDPQQVGVGRPVEIRLDRGDRPIDPRPAVYRHVSLLRRRGRRTRVPRASAAAEVPSSRAKGNREPTARP
jgi:hypothetical protein